MADDKGNFVIDLTDADNADWIRHERQRQKLGIQHVGPTVDVNLSDPVDVKASQEPKKKKKK